METTAITARAVAKGTGALLLLIGLACVPSIGQDIVLCILIVAAVSRPNWALKSLAVGTIMTFVSSPVLAFSGGAGVLPSILKWLLLFVACGRSLLSPVESSIAYSRLMRYWAIITGVLLINSMFISELPKISILKALSFSIGLLCVTRLSILTARENEEMLLFVAELGIALTVASAPMLVMAAGYSRNQIGFNGILNHPQALGVVLLMTGAATFWVSFRAPDMQRTLIVCALVQWSMIFFTKSRTPLVAMAVGGIAYIFEIFAQGGRESRTKFISVTAVSIVFTGLILVSVFSGDVREGFFSYLQKGDQELLLSANNPEEALRGSSRGTQISDGMEIAEQHPLLGYGFGVDPGSELQVTSNSTLFGGIPLSAPIEQGFLPLASVAQIGIFGSLIIVAFLISSYRLAHAGSAETGALFACVLGVNFGEMIFFSVGGLGILMWVLLILLAVSGSAPKKSLQGTYR